MKTFLFSLFLAAAAAATADIHMATGSVTGAPGDTVVIPLKLNETTLPSAGLNATIYLPEGMHLSSVVRGSLLPSPGFRLIAQALEDPSVNAVALLAYSSSQTISGTGTLCALLVNIPSDAGPGDYPVVLDAPDRAPPVKGCHALSSTNGASSLVHTAGDGILAVRIPGVPGDSNGNGIPDWWEELYFGVVSNVTDHTDFDNDGLSDYREHQADTDPTDPASCLAITDLLFPNEMNSGLVFQWYSISGVTYRIERGSDLASPQTFSRIGLDQSALPPVNVYTVQPPFSASASYYRVIRVDD